MVLPVLKNKMYDYILNNDDGVTAMQLAEVFDTDLHTVSGILIRLRGDGKVKKMHSPVRGGATLWYPNNRFYYVGKSRKY